MRSKKEKQRLRRKARVKKKIFGTGERPRLSVFKSSKHIYAQVIDDIKGETLAAAGTLSKSSVKGSGNKEGAKKVGEMIALKAKAKKVETVIFDRNGFKYHGRVKALADAAREKGLKF